MKNKYKILTVLLYAFSILLDARACARLAERKFGEKVSIAPFEAHQLFLLSQNFNS